ncbi:hypothetical protein QBC35DRAFT_78652 [Podospora australis]|uniref:Uncharacterized protein n=1 Tax=Podospora australis TaxID=1536484 RepID=A0AAN6WKM3_9PEZI|nr:hypothetical protein QBC35DRAFT_78652 [Podospora australis]
MASKRQRLNDDDEVDNQNKNSTDDFTRVHDICDQILNLTKSATEILQQRNDQDDKLKLQCGLMKTDLAVTNLHTVKCQSLLDQAKIWAKEGFLREEVTQCRKVYTPVMREWAIEWNKLKDKPVDDPKRAELRNILMRVAFADRGSPGLRRFKQFSEHYSVYYCFCRDWDGDTKWRSLNPRKYSIECGICLPTTDWKCDKCQKYVEGQATPCSGCGRVSKFFLENPNQWKLARICHTA